MADLLGTGAAADDNATTTRAAGCYSVVSPPPSPPPAPPPPPLPSPPPVVNRAKVTGTVTLEGYSRDSFGDTEQQAFAAGMANILKVAAEHVTVTVKDTRRRRLLATPAITLDYEIAVADVAAAVNIQARIKATASADLVVALKAAGLTEVSSAVVTVSDTIITSEESPPSPPPTPRTAAATPPLSSAAAGTPRSNIDFGPIAGIIAGVAVALTVASMVIFRWQRGPIRVREDAEVADGPMWAWSSLSKISSFGER